MSTPKNPPLGLMTASSGRFSLRIPLLGRDKVPLDTVFGLGERKHREAPVVAHKGSFLNDLKIVNTNSFVFSSFKRSELIFL
jgi:hypothetical protein